MKKGLIVIMEVVLVVCILICGLLYFMQEKLIFFPEKLDDTYQFTFEGEFEELNIESYDGTLLNGLLFKSDQSNGLILYFHGNAGSLASWGYVAKTYTDLKYDIFIFDFRSYGKSEGSIKSEEQLFQDSQAVYDELKRKYSEEQIVVLGYSIGSGLAAKLASTNSPRMLILQAPYYSLTDLMRHIYPIIPTFLLKYKLETHAYLKKCKMPVVIFHGDLDEIIYYGSSLKLSKAFKQNDTLITLHGQRHNGMTDNEVYKSELRNLLSTSNLKILPNE